MMLEMPLTPEDQLPTIKRILFLVKLLIRLDLFSEFLDYPEFKTAMDDPLEAIVKVRDAGGRVARFSSYLKRMHKANARERHKLLGSAVFSQLLNQMKEASEWSAEDNDRLSSALLQIRSQKAAVPERNADFKTAAVGIGSVLLTAGVWYAIRKKSPETKPAKS